MREGQEIIQRVQVPRTVLGGWYVVPGEYDAKVMKRRREGILGEKGGRSQRKRGL